MNVRDWKFTQRWCSWSRSCGLCWDARLFIFRHFEGTCRLRIHHLGFICQWRWTHYLFSKRRQSSPLLSTEEPRGLITMGNECYKEASYCTAFVLFILQSLTTGPHPLLHRVPSSVSALNFLFSLNAIQYQLTSFSSSSCHFCLSYLSFSNVF